MLSTAQLAALPCPAESVDVCGQACCHGAPVRVRATQGGQQAAAAQCGSRRRQLCGSSSSSAAAAAAAASAAVGRGRIFRQWAIHQQAQIAVAVTLFYPVLLSLYFCIDNALESQAGFAHGTEKLRRCPVTCYRLQRGTYNRNKVVKYRGLAACWLSIGRSVRSKAGGTTSRGTVVPGR